MAEELKDHRTKITSRTDAVLEALSRVGGKDKAEISREALDVWAEQKIHEATLIARLTKGEGRAGES
jgi:hypothetical protein